MILQHIKTTAAGIATIKDWLGEGMETVPSDQAEGRAAVCTQGNEGKLCPKNWPGDLWTSITKEAAISILSKLREKAKLKLRVSNEESLKTCHVCMCHLPLLVWVPVKHLEKHTSDEILNELPEICWKKKEILALRKQN